MASFARLALSGSTNGKPIKIGATGSPGTLIHTAINKTTSFDEVYLWVVNNTNGAVTLTIEWGGVIDPDDLLCKDTTITANSAPAVLIAGATLNAGLSIRAYSDTANAINLVGHVNRINE